jgi:hypothetical protein
MANVIETGADSGDAPEVPVVFVAVAVTVYWVPFVRPVTSQDQGARVTVHVPATTPVVVFAVTVYDAGVPPVPAFMVAVTLPSPATADTVGVPGFGRGVNESDTAGTGEVLSPIVAVALTVYGVPFVRPVTSQSPDAPGTVHAVPATTPAAVYAVTV